MTSNLLTDAGDFLITDAGDFLWFAPSDLTVQRSSLAERMLDQRGNASSALEEPSRSPGYALGHPSTIAPITFKRNIQTDFIGAIASIRSAFSMERLFGARILNISAPEIRSKISRAINSVSERLSALRMGLWSGFGSIIGSQKKDVSASEILQATQMKAILGEEILADGRSKPQIIIERPLDVRAKPPTSYSSIGPMRVFFKSGFFFQIPMTMFASKSEIERLLVVKKSSLQTVDMQTRIAAKSYTPSSWYGDMRSFMAVSSQFMGSVKNRSIVLAEWATPMSLRAASVIERLYRQTVKDVVASEVLPVMRGPLRAMMEFRGAARIVQKDLTERLLDARGFAISGASTIGNLRWLARIGTTRLALLPPTQIRVALEMGETVMFSAPAKVPLDWRLDVRGRFSDPAEISSSVRLAQRSLSERLIDVRADRQTPSDHASGLSARLLAAEEHLSRQSLKGRSAVDILGHVLARGAVPLNWNGAFVWQARGALEELIRVAEKAPASAEILLDVRGIAKMPEFTIGPVTARMISQIERSYPVSFKHAEVVEILLRVKALENVPVVWHGFGLVQKPRITGSKAQIFLQGEVD